MTINGYRALFDEGVLTSAKILKAPLEVGAYMLMVERKSGNLEPTTLARPNQGKELPKIYKSIDSALSDAKRIGFMEATVADLQN